MLKYILAILFISLPLKAETILLTTKNTVSLRTEVDDGSISKVQDEIQALVVERGSKDYPIYLVLDSPGGSIDAGNILIEYLKTVPNLKTITVFAASMASAIAQAVPGERLILESGTMMFHRAKATIGGQVETGELETRLAWIKKIVRDMERMNAERIGISLLEYKQKVKDEWWVQGSDNVSEGTADRVVSIKCSDALYNSKQKVLVQLFIFEVEGLISNCPLNRSIEIQKERK